MASQSDLDKSQIDSTIACTLSPLRSRAGSWTGTEADSDADQSMSLLSNADPAEMDSLEDSVRQSRTIEDFTKIISEFRIHRKTLYSDTLGAPGAASPNWGGSMVGSDDGSRRQSLDQVSEYGAQTNARCTCCCSRENCEKALRARQEWRDLQADLRLSAEIGQALLRRHDAMQAKSQKQAEEYIQQRDGLMDRLTRSYKETSALERQLTQANLNLEAADSSNRTLLYELDHVRNHLQKLKANQARLVGAEDKAKRLERELQDMKQELAAATKRAETAESKAKKLSSKNSQLSESLKHARKEVDIATLRSESVDVGEEALSAARQRLAAGLHASIGNSSRSEEDGEMMQIVDSLVKDNEALRHDNGKLKDLLDTCNEELAAVRDTGSYQETAMSASPNPERSPRPPSSLGFRDSYQLPASDSSRGPGVQRDGVATRADGDQTMVINDLEHTPSRPTALSDELVMQDERQSRTPRVPSISRSHPGRTLSRSSATSSGLVDGAPGSPRPVGLGLLSPPLKTDSGRLLKNDLPELTATGSSTTSHFPDSPNLAMSVRSSETSRDHDKAGSDFDQFFAEAVRKERDNRTAQLNILLEYIQRLFTRLSSADVDTLSKRLQRQHLAGDVGHLARTTVNSILRDIEGLREHFRRLIEQEAKTNARDDSSLGSGAKDPANESLISRKEFFALLKSFRDILCEVARLRMCINEIHMNPGSAAKLLNEHLGATAPEDRSLLPIPSAVGWLGKMLLGGPSNPGGGAATPSSAEPAKSSTTLGKGAGSATRAQPTRQISGGPPSHLAARASAAVVSTSLAVQVKGTHASAAEHDGSNMTTSPPPASGGLQAGPPSQRGRAPGSLSRVQSRNLSGLFVGTLGNPEGFASAKPVRPSTRGSGANLGSSMLGSSYRHRPLSRIVDDDEVSLHHGRSRHLDDIEDEGDFRGALLERTLRPRGLSDTSIRSTFIEQGTNPVARVITPATLALQYPIQEKTLRQQSSIDTLKSAAAKAETDSTTGGGGLLRNFGRMTSGNRGTF